MAKRGAGRRLIKKYKTTLSEKWTESLHSILPILLIVLVLCFFFLPAPVSTVLGFLVGSLMLIIGMGLFNLGTDLAMTPIGKQIGASVTRSRKLWLVLFVSFLVGLIVTVSEPDLQVLAGQVPGVPNSILIWTVAIGVGLFLTLAMLRILLRIRMAWLLLGCYGLVFGLSFFVPKSFLAVAFDAGGVTTGPMTVPFILAMGIGVSAIRSDANAENDSFGLVALSSVGPILAVMILSLIFRPEEGASVLSESAIAEDTCSLSALFAAALPEYLSDVAFALLPIAVFFTVSQFVLLKLPKHEILRILSGFLYAFLGLVLFLTGANVGFMPMGTFLGRELGSIDGNWVMVPVGMVMGYFVVTAEPAVHVLGKQVYELSAGTIPPKALLLCMSLGVSASVGFAMLRILTGISIMVFLIPGYAIALILMAFVPPIFTSIAFDSGGVASGPMTAAFLLPMAMGCADAVGGDVAEQAFGVVAMVAMTPLIAIQILGIIFKLKQKNAPKETDPRSEIEEGILD